VVKYWGTFKPSPIDVQSQTKGRETASVLHIAKRGLDPVPARVAAKKIARPGHPSKSP
jgi:hypothetical protein